MKLTKSKELIIVLVVVVIAAIAGYVIAQSQSSEDLVKLESYNDGRGQEVMCQAFMPSCGVCPGELREDGCYVTPEEKAKWE